MKKLLLSAGTEATEAALKLMRMNGQSIGKKTRNSILENNWHGRTMGSQMMSGNLNKKNGLDMKIKIFIIFSSLTLGL